MVISAATLKILKRLYKNKAKTIQATLESYTQNFTRPTPTKHRSYWYKNLILYTVYPDTIVYSKQHSPLTNLRLHIPHIKKLHCNAMYILPFLTSPLTDAGFDINDHYQIRNNLGSFNDLRNLAKKAHKTGIHLFMDLILNHVSCQHPWARKAQQGDPHYRNYFCTTKHKPQYLGKTHIKGAVFAKYRFKGKIIKMNIAFPEFAGTIPHWQKKSDGYWYYHTFYPEQLDLNWSNPHVFIELAKVMLFWGRLGFNFRLDAIPYVGRSGYKITDKPTQNSKGRQIMTALKLILQEINPQAILLAESYENIKQVIRYFGSDKQPLASLSYNFHLSTNIWISLIKKDSYFITQCLHQLTHIPAHADWLNFLRNHDELSFAHVNKIITQELISALAKYGKNFREGHGISGRTFSLLGASKKRFLMAYFLLASMPGSLMLTYGDEIAYANVAEQELTAAQKADTRNINRGIITVTEFNRLANKKVLSHLQKFFAKRIACKKFFNSFPQDITNKHPAILFICYKYGREKLLICINLSNQLKEIKLNTTKLQLVHSINQLTVIPAKLILGPYAGAWLIS